jgi:hypothetical protein
MIEADSRVRADAPEWCEPGAEVKRIGAPFTIGYSDIVWQTCIYPEGKARPVRPELLEPIPEPADV